MNEIGTEQMVSRLDAMVMLQDGSDFVLLFFNFDLQLMDGGSCSFLLATSN